MWFWEQERRNRAAEPGAQLGQVTLGGDTAVNLGGERRGLLVCVPGGILWRPAEGEQVLVLKTAQGERDCVVGCPQRVDGLAPGELRLTGNVTVEGESLADYIRRIAAEVAAGGETWN